MLSHMIAKEPGLRHTANEYLAEQKGKAFPEYFYSFLQSYMQIFSTDSAMVPDQKIMRSDIRLLSLLLAIILPSLRRGKSSSVFMAIESPRISTASSTC
jgi:phosphoinositide-3-kinase regulatory subunit 4